MSGLSPVSAAEKVALEATRELTNVDPSPFSPPAFELLKEKVGKYLSELVDESFKVSKRHQSDTVSAAHVQRASEYLVASSARRVFRHVGTVGGILLGGSLSNVLAMTMANQYTTLGTTVTISLAVAGTFMVAFNIARD